MILQKVQVTNFRSVDDSGEFDVNSVTCLVGKNEAGKSAILLALAALNPNKATPVTLDKERDFPRRHLVHYPKIHGNQDAVVVRTVWQLDECETQVIADDVGDGALTSPLVEVSRRYGQGIAVSAQLNCSAMVEHHLRLFALDAAERSMLKSPETTDQLVEALTSLSSPTEKGSSPVVVGGEDPKLNHRA
ncbi:MAG: AAA family ATPase, partial [Gemmatimonadota bacterium]|nr:AAA family ATPase [Gemmatimonadota bacterium]